MGGIATSLYTVLVNVVFLLQVLMRMTLHRAVALGCHLSLYHM